MKIFRPGMPVMYVDEPRPPKPQEDAEPNPLPPVEEAMKQAATRQAQILNYTKSDPLKENVPQPAIGNGPSDEQLAEQEAALLAQIEALQAKRKPHAVNSKPEVDK